MKEDINKILNSFKIYEFKRFKWMNNKEMVSRIGHEEKNEGKGK